MLFPLFRNLFIIMSLVCFWRCDLTEPDNFVPEYVVESYLFAGEPLPALRLSITAPFSQSYSFENQAVGSANVKLHLLNDAAEVAEEYPYIESARGIYLPTDSTIRVRPLRVYALEVRFPNESTVLRSRTTVPDTFSIIEVSADTVIFQNERQPLKFKLTRSFFPGRQNIFIFSTKIDSAFFRIDNLTPLARDFILNEEKSPGAALEELRISESPPINEANYTNNPDGSLTIDYPWLALFFFGLNRISANAIDENIFDFIRSQSIQIDPSTLSPGEIPNVIDHVEGGTGIFGSFSRVEKAVFVLRPSKN